MERIVKFARLGMPCLVLVAIGLGCLGGSAPQCTGEVQVSGKTYRGQDESERLAKRNACAKYCIEGDSEMDAMYRIWLDSLSEKERKRVRDGVKGKWDAIYDSERIKSYVKSCERKCLVEREVKGSCPG